MIHYIFYKFFSSLNYYVATARLHFHIWKKKNNLRLCLLFLFLENTRCGRIVCARGAVHVFKIEKKKIKKKKLEKNIIRTQPAKRKKKWAMKYAVVLVPFICCCSSPARRWMHRRFHHTNTRTPNAKKTHSSVSQIQYIYIVCGVTTATFPLCAAFHVQININFAVVDLILDVLVKHIWMFDGAKKMPRW